MPNVIPVPPLGRISEYAVPDKHSCLSGDLVVVEGPKGLAGVSLSQRALIWHYPYDPEPDVDAPDGQICARRSIDSPQWISADQRVVVTLIADRQIPHLVAIDGRSGKPLWEIEVELPREMLRKEKGLHTGWGRFSCGLKFVSRDDLLALCCVRYMSECGLVDHVQEPGESTFLVRIDPASGMLLWTSHLFGVRAGEGSINFRGPFLRGDEVGDIDWSTGQARVVHTRPGVRAWPTAHQGGILLASVDKGKITVEHIDRNGDVGSSTPWKRAGVKSLNWWPGSPMPVLQINNQGVVFVADDLSPRWEVKAKPWIYGASTGVGTPVIVATNGAGGHLLAFDRETGAECMRFTPAEGGVRDLVRLDGEDLYICTGDRELLCTDGHQVESVKFGGKVDDWQLLGVFERQAVYVSMNGVVRVRLVSIPATPQ
jgi:outer membrane protein assembly factor BamB